MFSSCFPCFSWHSFRQSIGQCRKSKVFCVFELFSLLFLAFHSAKRRAASKKQGFLCFRADFLAFLDIPLAKAAVRFEKARFFGILLPFPCFSRHSFRQSSGQRRKSKVFLCFSLFSLLFTADCFNLLFFAAQFSSLFDKEGRDVDAVAVSAKTGVDSLFHCGLGNDLRSSRGD